MQHIKADEFLDAGHVQAQPRSGQELGLYGQYFKRVFDLVLAIASLPVLGPVLFVLWALTKRDGGAGFYVQDRVGKDGKVFSCFKIRTMVENAETVLKDLCERDPEVAKEWNENQKLKNDPRITPIGKFLRKTSLDELPQIINVLKGDMSFVGPRPFMSDQDELYRAEGHLSNAYYKVRPGITGTWQVSGRGQTSFASRASYDTQYVRELSFKSDIGYILKTAGVVVKGSGH